MIAIKGYHILTLQVTEDTMNPRMQITWSVLRRAKDAGDNLIVAACRRIIRADQLGWRKHGRKADLALVYSAYEALADVA